VESSEKSLNINRYDMARLKAELKGEEIRPPEKIMINYFFSRRSETGQGIGAQGEGSLLELIVSQKKTALQSRRRALSNLKRRSSW